MNTVSHVIAKSHVLLQEYVICSFFFIALLIAFLCGDVNIELHWKPLSLFKHHKQ